jgi:hypothetical protein
MNTDLLFENAQLQGRVITLEAEVKCLEAVIRAHERVDCLSVTSLKKQLVEAEAENARLKAEVERLTAVSEAWKKRRLDKVEAECINWAEVEKENAHLKAIVESHHVDLNLQNNRLKAEVERLRKLGTEMGKHLPDTDEANRAYIDFEAGGKP